MRYSVLIALLIALGAPSAAAHGGQYKPPSDAGAGGSGHGFTAGPPTNPQGSGTPMPGAPDGVGSRSDGRGGDGRGTKRPVRSGLEIGEVTSGWENWWDANKDRYLDLSHRALAGTRTRSGPRHMTGLGRQGGGEPTRRPDASRVQGEVLPLLRELSAEGLDRDLVDSSVLALARSSRADSAAATLAVALPLRANEMADHRGHTR